MEETTASVQHRITGTTSVLHRDGEKNAPQQRQEERQAGQDEKNPAREEAKDHVADLSRAVEMANLYLQERNSPYRFGISLDGDDLIIEIEFTGGPGRTVKKNITHDDFLGIIDHILGGEGILYDRRY
jgi:hypothetical protein